MTYIEASAMGITNTQHSGRVAERSMYKLIVFKKQPVLRAWWKSQCKALMVNLEHIWQIE